MIEKNKTTFEDRPRTVKNLARIENEMGENADERPVFYRIVSDKSADLIFATPEIRLMPTQENPLKGPEWT